MLENSNIDGGRAFDWGRVSGDYAKYRDIYPAQFYQYLLDHDIAVSGQNILDLGTGTGVLPRNLYPYGARFTGVDSSEIQIRQAVLLAEDDGMNIDFRCLPAEDIDFPPETFDVVTACQCLPYFDSSALAPRISGVLKEAGRFVALYMAWLPYEDVIAGQSEELILKYNPAWTGCGEVRHPLAIPEEYGSYFTLEQSDVFDVYVPFTRETWNGRMKACRGIGASLSGQETADFEREHLRLLNSIAPEEFQVLHYTSVTILRKR